MIQLIIYAAEYKWSLILVRPFVAVFKKMICPLPTMMVDIQLILLTPAVNR